MSRYTNGGDRSTMETSAVAIASPGRTWRRACQASAFLLAVSAAVASAQTPAAVIPHAAWTLRSVDSQETTGGTYLATKAFDGDPSTMWSTAWTTGAPLPPHDLQIDLGASYAVSGFRYLPRQDGVSYGRIASYEFSVSTDGTTWGTPVAAATFPNVATEQQVLFTAKTGRFIRLRALGEVNGQAWTTIAELNALGTLVTATAPGTVSQAKWTLRSVDSQETSGGTYLATKAFDGNPATMWSTAWTTGAPLPPHDLQIDLGASYALTGFRYLPRQDGVAYGRIARYEFSVSTDGTTWGTPVAAATFPNVATEQTVAFAAKTGRFIRLRALSEVTGQAWTTVAELNVIGTAATGTPANDAPFITLTEVNPGAHIAPAAVSLHAVATDRDGTVTQVQLYAGTTLLQSVTTPTYDFAQANLTAGVHPFVAVARDNSGNMTVSNTLTITINGATTPATVLFVPSAQHDTLVDHYALEIFAVGADPATASPAATLDLGKPAVVNGDCSADVRALIAALPPGSYVGTVTAFAATDTAQSDASAQFAR